MSAAEIIHEIHQLSGSITVNQNHLKLRAPNPLPDDLVARVKVHKPDLLRLLPNGLEVYGVHLAEIQETAAIDWEWVKDDPDALNSLIRSIQTRYMRRDGVRPPHYTQACNCLHCGPVWLWQGVPSNVQGCPWCFNRIAGRPIPRPEKADYG